MEETLDQLNALLLQSAPAAPSNDSDSANNVVSQPPVSPAAGSFPDPVIVNSQLPAPQQAPDRNHNLLHFLQYWDYLKSRNLLQNVGGTPQNYPSILRYQCRRVKYEDLQDDKYDLQGIDWQAVGVTRSSARKYRVTAFRSHTDIYGSGRWNPTLPDRLLSRHENYFRFRSMDLRADVLLAHYRSRSILGCASRTAVYYPNIFGVVVELDPSTGHVKTAMRFKSAKYVSVSTLAADEGILLTGTYHGRYSYLPIETEDTSAYYGGELSGSSGDITHHVQIHSSRGSSMPLATFASDNGGIRMVDLTRNEIIFRKIYDHPLKCTALSPDKRLRVMVGDNRNVLIIDSERGDILQSLDGHRDFGVACDWAPNNWNVATANEDQSIRIWDARKWRNSKGEATSIATIRSEMACARSLRFSPLGSGKPLLLAAETADVINLIDAQTFDSKQTIDIFGELAGVSFTGAGQEIVALSSDPVRGGILSLERCDHGAKTPLLPTPTEVVNHLKTQVKEDWFFK
ncbi:WD40 repeat-like protein [Xylaria arbuscula]|nr:WD40 repeat-like protein [Xylaria arbuscula]